MDKGTLQRAINTYGKDAQSDMVIEEALELALAILKHRRAIRCNCSEEHIKLRKDNVVEECADTRIMLEQVNMMFDCEKDVDQQIELR